MISFDWRRGTASRALIVSALLALPGCEGGASAPGVSSSRTLVTVTGTVVYKGKPVNEGEVRFNPANVARRDAPTATAPIQDGKYTIQAMVGENSVSCSLPTLGKDDQSLRFASFIFDVPAAGGTYDVDLSKK